MRHNGRPILYVSRMSPNLVALFEHGGRPLVECPECGLWKSIKRGMVVVHHDTDYVGWPAEFRPEAPLCPGTGTRVRVDEDFAAWRQRLDDAAREAAGRRGTRVVRRPKPPAVPAVHQLAAAR
jgi:hypothetical protein